MQLRRFQTGLLTSVALVSVGGCGLEALFPTPKPARVIVLGVEHLGSPAVKEVGVYRPDLQFPIDPADPASGEASGFIVTVATSAPDELLLYLTGSGIPGRLELSRVQAPPDEMLMPPATGFTLPADVAARLRAGEGVFWLASDGAESQHRIGVAIPASQLAHTVTLHLVTAFASDGTPILGDTIELVPGFFYMTVIGESVAWGNGLPDAQKYSSLVAREIEHRTNLRVIRRVHAISGTKIVPEAGEVVCRVSCNGEVQTASTSILTQVDLIEAPIQQQLVLVSGCINDVGVPTIISTTVTDEELTAMTQRFCGDEILGLLRKLRATAPTATVVITGYYPIVGEQSNLPQLLAYMVVGGEPDGTDSANVVRDLAAQAALFVDVSSASINGAVETVNAETGGGTAFVSPGFGPEHALFSPDSWLWGLGSSPPEAEELDLELALFPEDPLASVRAASCFGEVLVDPIDCLYSSVGHPNPTGAQVYAGAILARLEAIGAIPASQPG